VLLFHSLSSKAHSLLTFTNAMRENVKNN